MKAIALGLLVGLGCFWGRAADVVSDFSSTNEGWTVVSHVRSAGPLPASGITASNQTPAVANGFLRVQDLNDDWNWIVAPARFLGDWRQYATAGLGLVTDDAPTVYALVLFLSGSHDGGATTNSASFTFPLGNIPASSRLDPVAPLAQAQWTVHTGTWTNLLTNVQQFWIRMDLNSNVAGELDLVDYVKLVDGSDTTLKIFRAVELEFFAPANVNHQIQVSTDLTVWKNYGLPFVGNGQQQVRSVRIGDQEGQHFRVLRTP